MKDFNFIAIKRWEVLSATGVFMVSPVNSPTPFPSYWGCVIQLFDRL